MKKCTEQQSSVGVKYVATFVHIFGFEALFNSDLGISRELTDAIANMFKTADYLMPEESKEAPTYPLVMRAYGYEALFIAGSVYEKLDDTVAIQMTCRYTTSVLYLASFFQTRLLMEHGLFAKGRVTMGDLYTWGGEICGPVIFRAERGEADVEYPRIEVDRHVAELFIESAVKMGLATESEAESVFADIDEDSVFIRTPLAQIVFAKILRLTGSDLVKSSPLSECMGKTGVQCAIERYDGEFGKDPYVHEMCRWLSEYQKEI